MIRYFFAVNGTIPVLEADITDEDWCVNGSDPEATHTDVEIRSAACSAAERMIRHTGLDAEEMQYVGQDIR